MAKPKRNPSIADRFRDFLDDLTRLLNPPKQVPVRVPVPIERR
ncbi:MAG: hypothetical protein ABI947_06170 [Chloroflexota bacterium]